MTDFRVPSLGADMEAGTLVQWLKRPGDRVTRGDIIAVVDTQKGAIDIEVLDVLTSLAPEVDAARVRPDVNLRDQLDLDSMDVPVRTRRRAAYRWFKPTSTSRFDRPEPFPFSKDVAFPCGARA